MFCSAHTDGRTNIHARTHRARNAFAHTINLIMLEICKCAGWVRVDSVHVWTVVCDITHLHVYVSLLVWMQAMVLKMRVVLLRVGCSVLRRLLRVILMRR